MPTPQFNLLPTRQYELDGVTFHFVPYLTPAMERKSRAALMERESEKVTEIVTRYAWFSIVRIEYNGETTTPDDISLDPAESLCWAEENIPYRVFVEISRALDIGDYPLGRSSKMDENGVPEMTVLNFLAMTLPLFKESIGPSTPPSPESSLPTSGSSEPSSVTE